MWFEDFQDVRHGGPIGYRNGILNLHGAQMLSNLTYRSGADNNWRFSRWPPWRSSWISQQSDCTYSESPCRPNATKFWLNRNYHSRADVVLRSSYLNRMISAILNLYVAPMSPIKFRLNPTYGLCEDIVFKEFQDGRRSGHFEYQNGTILAVLNFHVSPKPSTKFRLNTTYHSGADVVWRFWRWPLWRISLI